MAEQIKNYGYGQAPLTPAEIRDWWVEEGYQYVDRQYVETRKPGDAFYTFMLWKGTTGNVNLTADENRHKEIMKQFEEGTSRVEVEDMKSIFLGQNANVTLRITDLVPQSSSNQDVTGAFMGTKNRPTNQIATESQHATLPQCYRRTIEWDLPGVYSYPYQMIKSVALLKQHAQRTAIFPEMNLIAFAEMGNNSKYAVGFFNERLQRRRYEKLSDYITPTTGTTYNKSWLDLFTDITNEFQNDNVNISETNNMVFMPNTARLSLKTNIVPGQVTFASHFVGYTSKEITIEIEKYGDWQIRLIPAKYLIADSRFRYVKDGTIVPFKARFDDQKINFSGTEPDLRTKFIAGTQKIIACFCADVSKNNLMKYDFYSFFRKDDSSTKTDHYTESWWYLPAMSRNDAAYNYLVLDSDTRPASHAVVQPTSTITLDTTKFTYAPAPGNTNYTNLSIAAGGITVTNLVADQDITDDCPMEFMIVEEPSDNPGSALGNGSSTRDESMFFATASGRVDSRYLFVKKFEDDAQKTTVEKTTGIVGALGNSILIKDPYQSATVGSIVYRLKLWYSGQLIATSEPFNPRA